MVVHKEIKTLSGKARMDAFISKMNDLKLNQLVVYFNGMHTFLEPNIVFLLSGMKSMGESMLVMDSDGRSSLIITPSWDLARAKERTQIENVIATDDLFTSFLQLAESEMKTFDESTGFIGINNLKPYNFSKLSAVFKGQLNSVDREFIELTSRKTEEEINNAKKATWIAERGYEEILKIVKPGMYDYQLAGELVSFTKSLGADDNFLLMSASQHNQAVRPPGKRRLEEGDIVLAEISPSYQGQFSQICRTAVIGNESHPIINEKYELLIHAMEKGIEAAKPGVRMSEVVQKINKPIEEAGYGKYCVPPYMRVRGHGLGLSSLLPGDVSKDNDIVLREGMFFVIHPNQYIPETGYLLCGEPILISNNGAERLTTNRSSLGVIHS